MLAFGRYTSLSEPPRGYSQGSYLGIDVIVTKGKTETKVDILEINAPPSLDTATGIEEAEWTHEGNVGGIFRQFIMGDEGHGRWVRLTNDEDDGGEEVKVPRVGRYNALRSESVNKMKYKLYERKTMKAYGVAGVQVNPGVVQERTRGR